MPKKNRSRSAAARGRYLFEGRTFDGVRVASTLTIPEAFQLPGYLSPKSKGVPEHERRLFDVHLDAAGKVLQKHVRTPPPVPSYGVKSQFYSILRRLFFKVKKSERAGILERRFGESVRTERFLCDQHGNYRRLDNGDFIVRFETHYIPASVEQTQSLSDDWRAWDSARLIAACT